MTKSDKKETEAEQSRIESKLSVGLSAAISFAAAVIYYFSNPKPQSYYDYTFRVAGNMLHGGIAFADKQPSWLNEFVPFEGVYYSVFPLGAVVTMLPFALLKTLGVITEMPGAFIAALLAGISCWFLLKIASRYSIDRNKQILLTLAILFGTFAWTNLTFTGAWQLALGFAMLGEIGAIYFTVYDRRPFIAGIFFALAFGNRTEILLTAPVFMYLLWRSVTPTNSITESDDARNAQPPSIAGFTDKMVRLALFCSVPFVLGVATLVYNYVRFHSFTDFGYARIPGVLEEPWYDHGIFSITYIPRQAAEMLWKGWQWKDKFPHFIPDGFSSSILWSSPFLLLLLRFGSRDKLLKYASWASVAILTFLLWIHGNSGGWQFGYRYAMVLLPWIFVILLESSPKKITPLGWVLCGVSFAMNAYATWLFHWTEYMK